MSSPDVPVELPGRISMRPGESASFPLPSGAMGGGYSWSVEPSGDDAARARIDVLPPPAQDPSGPPAATTGSERLVVTAVRPGTLSLRLRLARSWDPQAAIADRSVEVVVEQV